MSSRKLVFAIVGVAAALFMIGVMMRGGDQGGVGRPLVRAARVEMELTQKQGRFDSCGFALRTSFEAGGGGGRLRGDGSYESLGEALVAVRHAVEQTDPAGVGSRGAGYYAHNPRQRLRAWFSGDGVELASGVPTPDGEEEWGVKLSLSRVGRTEGGAPGEVLADEVKGSGQRVEIWHRGAALTQWFENRVDGLEQGFTLEKRPAGGAGDVVVLLDIGGSLRAEVIDGVDDAVRFVDAGGAEVLHYTGLKAWDAGGQALSARIEVRGPESLALVVADAGASYPVTIDPWFVNVEARLVEETAADDHFGRSVAISGDTALIGMPDDDTAAGQSAGSAHVFVRAGGEWRHQAKLTAAVGAHLGQFGTSVALSGDTAVVGAPRDTLPSGSNRGSAHVFQRSGEAWSLQQVLVAEDETAYQFGTSVAIDGDTILIGAPYSHLFTSIGPGSACVFVRSGEGWIQQAALVAGDDSLGDEFGFSVALSGDLALVGAPQDDWPDASNAGSAYVFTRVGTDWSETAKLAASDVDAGKRFGYSVAIEGQTAVIGAPFGAIGSSNLDSDPGSAYVFSFVGESWSEQARLTAETSSMNDHFGWAVALSGDTLLVGAPGGFTPPEDIDPSKVYLFRRNAGTWDPEVTFAGVDESFDEGFGTAVACAGNTVLIGSAAMDTAAGHGAGAAFVFAGTGVTWSQQAMLVASDGTESDEFGSSVAISGDLVLVGAPQDSRPGGGSGSAWVFERSGSLWREQARLTAPDRSGSSNFGTSVALDNGTAVVGTFGDAAYVFVRTGSIWGIQQKLTPDAVPEGIIFGGAVSIAGETVVVGAFDLNRAPEPGRAYVFTRSGSSWSMQAQLTAPDPLSADAFGASVAAFGDTVAVGAPEDSAGAGSVHVFTRSGTSWSRQATLRDADASAGDRFGYSVALAQDIALIGAPRADAAGWSDAGRASVFVRSNGTWARQAVLSPGDGRSDDHFGHAVALAEAGALVGAPDADLPAGSSAGSAYLFTRSGSQWTQQVKLTSGFDASSMDRFGWSLGIAGDTAVVGASWDETKAPFGGGAYAFRLGELPTITSHPVSRTVVPGSPVTFEVTASGYAPLSYRWRKDGNPIAGASGNIYSIPSVEPAHQGSYDCVVSNVGGVATTAPAHLTVNALSQFAREAPNPPPAAQGYVLVTILPSGIGGWRFAGEQQWRPAGVPVGGLATGNRVIEFRPVPGRLQPPPETASVVSGGTVALVVGIYYDGEASGSGGVTVSLKPDELAAGSLPVAERAQWRLLGEDDSQWRNADEEIQGLVPGDYLIECKQVPGRTTPPPGNIVVRDGHTAAITLTYFLADLVAGTSAVVLPFETVTGSSDLPYAHVGQIRSDAGSSSGFVVRSRVVATAGHVVFDDAMLSAATGLQWLLQRDRASYEPPPQIPRGFYLFDGYSAQRRQEGTPGTSTPQSQDLDAAALYFLGEAGRGGYAGYLASDAQDNEFLHSSSAKMLVGYPVDGIASTHQGRMHATPPGNLAFSRVIGHTYRTSDLHGTGGMSGGPLCVQFEGGNFYPAAIYLGGSGQTVVRAIDSQVIELFNRAEVSGNGGSNNTGGGITHTSVSGTLSATQPGSLRVLVEPAAARAAGAGWRLRPETAYRSSGSTKGSLRAGTYLLELSTVAGFQQPAEQSVTVTGGQLKTVVFSYAGALSPLEVWRGVNFGSVEDSGDAADTADPDRDGRKNIEEYAAGTDPNDAADALRVLGGVRTAGGFTVTAAGKAGRVYVLQRSLGLGGGLWSDVASVGPLSADGPVELTDGESPAGQAFYRFRVAVP